MQHNSTDNSWMFSVLLLLIIGPFIFYIVSLFIAWIKWLFFKKEKLNASFSEIKDIKNPITEKINIKYNLGIDTEIQFNLLDYNYNPIQSLLNSKANKGNHVLEFDSKQYQNGQYIIQLTTDNQKITKIIDIIN